MYFFLGYDRLRDEILAELRKQMMFSGLKAVGGATLAVYTWKKTNNVCLATTCSLVGLNGAYTFCFNLRNYFKVIHPNQKQRIQSTWNTTCSVLVYCGGVWEVSRSLKDNSRLWIPSLATSVYAYYLAVTSANDLGRTILNRKPFLKFSQLMFGPALISGAAYYLRCVQGHEEEWLYCFPLVACCIVGRHMTLRGLERVESRTEPRWLLFKGMEILIGGSLVLVTSAVLSVHAINNNFNPWFTIYFTAATSTGIMSILESLEAFYQCTDMDQYVFGYISFMTIGPIVFSSACLLLKVVDSIYRLPIFLALAGTGVSLVVIPMAELYERVSWQDFCKYCQCTLGPWCLVYGIIASSYVGFHMGWRCSLVPAPLLPAGMYLTYRGFS